MRHFLEVSFDSSNKRDNRFHPEESPFAIAQTDMIVFIVEIANNDQIARALRQEKHSKRMTDITSSSRE